MVIVRVVVVMTVVMMRTLFMFVVMSCYQRFARYVRQLHIILKVRDLQQSLLNRRQFVGSYPYGTDGDEFVRRRTVCYTSFCMPVH